MTLQEQEDEVLNIIKIRWGIMDDTKDKFINSYIKEIERRILNSCNRSDIPDALLSVWASMVMDVLNVEMPGQFGGGVNVGAMNIKIGDTTISPSSAGGVTTSNKTAIDQIVLNYMADLHRWRKLKW